MAHTTAPNGSSVGTFNDADVAFAQAMIPHHQQALDMAEMALDPAVGASTDVVALPTNVKAAQQAETDMMTSWLQSWGQPPDSEPAGHDMTETSAMSGLVNPTTERSANSRIVNARALGVMCEQSAPERAIVRVRSR